jgi:hypothetical protein
LGNRCDVAHASDGQSRRPPHLGVECELSRLGGRIRWMLLRALAAFLCVIRGKQVSR